MLVQIVEMVVAKVNKPSRRAIAADALGRKAVAKARTPVAFVMGPA